MKKVAVLAVVMAIGGTAASVATSASPAVPAWTKAKAERMLKQDGTVRFPVTEQAALESELRQGLMQFSALAYAAAEMTDVRASLAYERIAGEYRRALAALVGGLQVVEADCMGSGRALAVQRFRRFDCLVISELLRIPTTEFEGGEDGTLPAVVQGKPRSVGPALRQLKIRVTGAASFTYQ